MGSNTQNHTSKKDSHLLNLIDPIELTSFLLFYKHPLYQYRNDAGNLDVLCLGSSELMRQLILSITSCGQMLHAKLNIHIVSTDSEDAFTNELLSKAPGLADYSNLGKNNPYEYVTFSYEQVDAFRLKNCKEVAATYSTCRYIIVDTGEQAKSTRLAELLATSLSDLKSADSPQTIINYFSNEKIKDTAQAIASHIKLAPFDSSLSSSRKDINALGERALKVSYLYEKLGNPHASKAAAIEQFCKDAYAQRSSTAAALHLNYKLASVGIDPHAGKGRRDTISAYSKFLRENSGLLIELEHRRWLMYMVSDGYTCPTMQELDNYSFRMVNGTFNAAFKCTDTPFRKHHCIVPCSQKGITLPSNHSEWDRYSSLEEIDSTDYDPLDKMSLKVHLLAKKRMQHPSTASIIISIVNDKIGSRLPDPVSETDDLTQHFAHLSEQIEQVVATQTISAQIFDDIADVEHAFCMAGIIAADAFIELRNQLSIFVEFSRYRDYKLPDTSVINCLPWLLYADSDITLIKLRGRTLSDNIMCPLILEPKTLFYFSSDEDESIRKFFKTHGDNIDIHFIPYKGIDSRRTKQRLQQLIKTVSGRCVIDISGADESLVAAAVQSATVHNTVSIVRYSEQLQTIEDISGFSSAAAYSLKTSLSANEVYELYGATPHPMDNSYMRKLGSKLDQLWTFYMRYRDQWEMIYTFFSKRGRGTSEFYLQNYVVDEKVIWRPYERIVKKYEWNRLELSNIFRDMEASGFIRELSINDTSIHIVKVSFKYPGSAFGNDLVFDKFNTFFGRKMNPEFPLSHNITSGESGFCIDIISGYQVDIYVKESEFEDKKTGKRYSYRNMIEPLNALRQMGAISDLEIKDALPFKIKFVYNDLSVKDCLTTAGNILEAYVWWQAQLTGYFDDCTANFKFSWKERIKNEIDVILTRNLTTLVVSCKTAKFNKEHLYEIKYLTDRFSLNSKAVIVYSSNMAVDDNGHLTSDISAVKERARAMGIYLIDVNSLEAQSLGSILVGIAEGTYPC